MSPHLHWWIEEQERKALSSIEMAATGVRHARTLMDLARASGHVHVDALVRHQPAVTTAMSRLSQEAADRAEELCKQLLGELTAAPNDDRIRSRVTAAYRSCCGVFPKQARELFNALLQARRHRDEGA